MEALKKKAGDYAAEFVKNGMTVGLGTGSTVKYLIENLARRVAEDGLEIIAVSTSERTTKLAESLGMKISDLNEVSSIDLTIDGVDEFDSGLNGIKGGGGALLFEKIVASHSKENIWVADGSKAVDQLGAFPLPVEVVPFGWKRLSDRFEEKGYCPVLRKDEEGRIFTTDSSNYILDLHLQKIGDAEALEAELNLYPGTVENGLFINRTSKVILAGDQGIKEISRH